MEKVPFIAPISLGRRLEDYFNQKILKYTMKMEDCFATQIFQMLTIGKNFLHQAKIVGDF